MLSRLERAIERVVEGSVAGAFRLRVQPAEIGRHLERAMLDGRRTSVGLPLVPNRYLVRLHPDDAAQFAGWEEALGRELEGWLAELAYARGLAMVSLVQVSVVADSAVPRRAVRAEASFVSGDTRAPAAAGEGPRRLTLHPEDDTIPAVTLAGSTVRIGRADDNDVVFADPEVSRYHARLEWSAGAWWVRDLGSTNGTLLNGAVVERAVISPGDSITFGRMRFAVRE